MKNILYLLALLFISCIHINAQRLPAEITVSDGIIQGTVSEDMTIFKGVPFAAPPVGQLRWKAPQPVQRWEGVKITKDYAPAPMQGGNPASGKSEDCLYLNIWTPALTAQDKLPVMVWIYGGGFGFGSTSDPVHNGEHLARKGVILVSIAYRVGQLGFLAHPELSAEDPNGVSGNYGILDQIAGLAWIQRNIAAFGGDPSKVTIFGESAGAISVSMLCASPLAKGLFQAAISQSGGSFGPTRSTTYPGENMKTLPQAEQDGIRYVSEAGVTSIEALRKLDAEKLIPQGWTMAGGWPIMDGYVIPDDQYKLYEAGKYNDVPVLIGYNSDEGLSFSSGNTPEAYKANVHKRFGPFAEKLIEAYPLTENKVGRSARNLMRDAAFGWHTWSWARLQDQTGKSDIYCYIFDRHPDYPEDSPLSDHGTPHGMDVAYVFMNLDRSNPSVTTSELDFSALIATYWTNFAKYGNPNGEGLPPWPSFTGDNPKLLYLGKEIYQGPVPDEASLKTLDSYFSWRRSDEGKEWAK